MDIDVLVNAKEQNDERSQKFIRDQICQIEIHCENQNAIFLKEKNVYAGQAFTKVLTRAK